MNRQVLLKVGVNVALSLLFTRDQNPTIFKIYFDLNLSRTHQTITVLIQAEMKRKSCEQSGDRDVTLCCARAGDLEIKNDDNDSKKGNN